MIQVKAAEAADLLAEIHAQAFSAGWSAAFLSSLMTSQGVVVLADDDDRGFVMVRAAGDEAEILTLAVRPAARRRGIGRRLVRSAADAAACRGARVLLLEAAADNLAALALYREEGFCDAGRRRGYYPRPDGPPVDALLLRKVLP